jgi:hypothetical protein
MILFSCTRLENAVTVLSIDDQLIGLCIGHSVAAVIVHMGAMS